MLLVVQVLMVLMVTPDLQVLEGMQGLQVLQVLQVLKDRQELRQPHGPCLGGVTPLFPIQVLTIVQEARQADRLLYMLIPQADRPTRAR